MSRIRESAEQLARFGGTRFVFLIALVAGIIRSIPGFLFPGNQLPVRPLTFLLFGAFDLLWWVGALILWWVAVRRASSMWIVAAQVTIGLFIGEVFGSALGMVSASIEGGGEVAVAVGRHLGMIISSNLGLALIRAPLIFVGSLLVLQVGRSLLPGWQDHPPAPAAPEP
jgi:hypothetical protein